MWVNEFEWVYLGYIGLIRGNYPKIGKFRIPWVYLSLMWVNEFEWVYLGYIGLIHGNYPKMG